MEACSDGEWGVTIINDSLCNNVSETCFKVRFMKNNVGFRTQSNTLISHEYV